MNPALRSPDLDTLTTLGLPAWRRGRETRAERKELSAKPRAAYE